MAIIPDPFSGFFACGANLLRSGRVALEIASVLEYTSVSRTEIDIIGWPKHDHPVTMS
jgi:hypothetical protein